MLRYHVMVGFFLFSQYTDAQSGWTRPQKSWLIQLDYAYASSNTYFDNTGNLTSPARRFNQQKLNFDVEYGFKKNITLISHFPIQVWQNFDNYTVAKGIGNPQLEIKWALLKKIPVVCFTLGAELPLSNQNNISVAQTPTINSQGTHFDEQNLPTGYPDFHSWGTLSVSSGLGNLTGWITFFNRYTVRASGYNHQENYGLELGYKWTRKLTTVGRLEALLQIGNSTSAATILNGQHTAYTTLRFGADYKLTSKFIFNGSGHIFNNWLQKRKNMYSAPFFKIGLSVVW